MAKTVTQVLTAATDSVTLIDAVDGGTKDVSLLTQAEINDMVQRNVDHLEIILAYTDPDVVNDSSEAATPEQMLELKKAEQGFELQMKELEVDVFKLEVQDKQDARGKFSKDWTARIMGIVIVGGFMGYIFLVTLQPPEQNSEALINLVLGYLGGLASAVISFYFGASNTPDKDN